MNQFLKKALSFGLASAMVATALSGCGDNGSSSTPDNSSQGGSSVASGETFKLGSMGPLTGPNASYGISVNQGAQIAVDEINAAGGVLGKQIEFFFQDDESDAETAMSAYNKLMDNGIQALLGATTSGPTIALTDLTNEDGILQLTPSGSAIECTQYDNCFRICFTDPLQGVTMADGSPLERGESYGFEVSETGRVMVELRDMDEHSLGRCQVKMEQGPVRVTLDDKLGLLVQAEQEVK